LHWLKSAVTGHPELAIFLTMAIGFFVGRLHYESIKLGAVTGTLLAGVLRRNRRSSTRSRSGTRSVTWSARRPPRTSCPGSRRG
jgi:hypothetical protein